jgi:hypothetical protein
MWEMMVGELVDKPSIFLAEKVFVELEERMKAFEIKEVRSKIPEVSIIEDAAHFISEDGFLTARDAVKN